MFLHFKITVILLAQVLLALSDFVKTPGPEVRATSGSTVKFDWQIEPTDLVSIIEWKLNGNTIVFMQRVNTDYTTNIGAAFQGRASVDQKGMLEIQGATLQDEGTVSCGITLSSGGVVFSSSTTFLVTVPPTFIATPPPSIADNEGDSNITLNCGVQSKPASTIKWYHENTLLSSGGRYLISSNSTTTGKLTALSSILNVTNIRRTDRGVYKCVVEYEFGNQERSSSLSVFYPSTIINFPPSRVGTVEYATNFELSCQIESHPEPTVKWYKNTLLIDQSNTNVIVANLTKQLELYDSILRFVNITKDDFGNYTCEAENIVPGIGVQTTQKSATVIVSHKPYFLEKPEQQIMSTLGATIRLNCTVQAYPEPTVTWTTTATPSNRFVQFASRVLFEDQGRVIVERILEVRSLRKEDHGNYSCTADDGTNQNKATTTIYVKYSPVILQSPPANQTVAEHTLNYLDCIIESYPMSHIDWFYAQDGSNFINITLQSSLEVLRPISYESKLRSRLYFRGNNNISREEEGVYECRTNNELGANTTSSTITVDWPPEFGITSINGETITATKGDSISFQCIVASNPFSDITWRKDNLNTVPTSQENLLFQNSTTTVKESIIAITNIQSINAGLYTCEAKTTVVGNIITRNRERRIIVLHPPEILLQNQTYEATISQSLTLGCTNRATPAVTTYEWKKDGSNIDNNQTDLTFFNIEKENEGIYTCTPYNSQGKGETVVHTVIVKVAPTFTITPECTEITSNIYCHCDGVGYPSPRITWTIQGRNTVLSNVSWLNSTINQLHHGNIVCTLSNSHGSISRNATGVITPAVSDWDSWSSCNTSCGVAGYQKRGRRCNYFTCPHNVFELQSCLVNCPVVAPRTDGWHEDWYIALWVLIPILLVLLVILVIWCSRKRRGTSKKAFFVPVNHDVAHSQPPSLRSLSTRRDIFLPERTSGMSAVNKGFEKEPPLQSNNITETDTIEVEMQFGPEFPEEGVDVVNANSIYKSPNTPTKIDMKRDEADGDEMNETFKETDFNYLNNNNSNDKDNSFLQFYDDPSPPKPPRGFPTTFDSHNDDEEEKDDRVNFGYNHDDDADDDDDNASITFNTRKDGFV